jgi:hypothetical protein
MNIKEVLEYHVIQMVLVQLVLVQMGVCRKRFVSLNHWCSKQARIQLAP